MLIEFTVKNFRSIKEEAKLSLIKAKGKELEAYNTFTPEVPGSFSLLRSAAIYGPNAAGKTNIIKALQSMRKIVQESASQLQRGDELPLTPFLFDSETRQQPSEFEAIFVSEGIRYQYGFTATKQRIFEEWLIAYPKGRAQRWFNREYDIESSEYIWEMGDKLMGPKQLWQQSTRHNALFLSTAIQLNSKPFKPIFDWFEDILHISIGSFAPSLTMGLYEEGITNREILKFLHAADIGISGLMLEKTKLSSDGLSGEVSENTKKATLDESEMVNVITLHKTEAGEIFPLEFHEESDGTQKVFSYAGPWLNALNNGYVLVIDELHDNLHPLMVEFLIKLFHSDQTNPKNAQLIFTTHETSILDQQIFRRDQVWFCEKNQEQSTVLYPLTDFHPRKHHENLEKSYLAGRYGALPYLRDINKAMEL